MSTTASAGVKGTAYQREHWTKWYTRDLLQIAYWPKYVASQMDWASTSVEKIVDELVEAGITLLSWGGPENWFPITAGAHRRHPALDRRDSFFDELISLCHANGIKVLLGFSGNGGREGKRDFIKANWPAFEKQGARWRPDGLQLVGHGTCLFNDVFVNGILEGTRALMERYPIDATFIDTPVHRVPVDPQTQAITCDYCRDQWKRISGNELAPREDWDDPQWRQFVEWQQQIVVGHLKKMRDVIKGVDERILITANMVARPADTVLHKTNPNPASLRGVIDSMHYESVFLPYNMMDVQVNLKFGHLVTGYNPGVILKNWELIFKQGYAHAEPSAIETELLAYLSLSHGASVTIHSTMDESGRPHELRTKVYIDVCKKLQKDLPYFEASTPKVSVGVVYSRNTRDRFAARNWWGTLAAYEGAEQMLVNNHVPSMPLLDEDLTAEKLSGYKAVLLPNVACMSDDAVAAVRQFVQGGGTVIASNETSLYDENERFRGEFGLADVFGVSLNSALPLAEKILEGREPLSRQPYRLKGHPFFEGLHDSEIMHVPWFSIAPAGAEVAANWLEVREGTNHGCVNLGREIIGEYDEPCITVNRFGKGTAVYFSGPIFHTYSQRALRYYTQMFRQIFLGTDSLEVFSDGPKSIELTLLEQADHDRLNVHLVNLVNTNRWYNSLVYSRSSSSPELHRSGHRDDFKDEHLKKMAMAFRVKDTGDTTGPIDEVVPVYDVPVYLSESLVKGRRIVIAGDVVQPSGDAPRGFVRVTVPEVVTYARISLEK